MAKLIIFRGEAQIDERELKEQTVRIGRGAQNDLILEDPGKGVSRNHAEIRFEGGRYTLVDLQSQNGIWVSGTRVSSVVLEPGVSAALGPFRLMVPGPPPSPASTPPSSGIYPATEMTQMSERSAAPLKLDSLAPAPEKKSPPKPVVEKAAPPVAKPVPKPIAKKTTPGPAPSTSSRFVVGAVAAVLLIGVSAYIGYKLMHKTPPAWDATVAQQLIDSGRCPEAMDTQITPALRQNPANELALKLRERCSQPVAAATSSVTSSIPADPTPDEKLNAIEPTSYGECCLGLSDGARHHRGSACRGREQRESEESSGKSQHVHHAAETRGAAKSWFSRQTGGLIAIAPGARRPARASGGDGKGVQDARRRDGQEIRRRGGPSH